MCVLVAGFYAPVAWADPDGEPAAADAVEAPAPPADDGRVVSPPPVSSKGPDGWTLILGAKEETQTPQAPLTTALSSRDYVVGGTFDGSLWAPEDTDEPNGTIEVGYQIGCGVDMSTSNGVTLTGTAGVSPSVGLGGVDVVSPLPDGLIPVLTTPVTGGIAIGLKPGIINIVPVTKKEFQGFAPWVMISNFHIKIDGCVGQSFIRSYAFLTRSTKVSDQILAYYGETKVV
ncbi:MspA protein [Mycobacterium hodleri]|uniref:MspA protein n=1 Tax=Mycolicibacterium hodleri TaxID=49897 RepID=A0A502E8I2_9MYCO|nr:MspA protein [Mycolicibacterium hodleri]